MACWLREDETGIASRHGAHEKSMRETSSAKLPLAAFPLPHLCLTLLLLLQVSAASCLSLLCLLTHTIIFGISLFYFSVYHKSLNMLCHAHAFPAPAFLPRKASPCVLLLFFPYYFAQATSPPCMPFGGHHTQVRWEGQEKEEEEEGGTGPSPCPSCMYLYITHTYLSLLEHLHTCTHRPSHTHISPFLFLFAWLMPFTHSHLPPLPPPTPTTFSLSTGTFCFLPCFCPWLSTPLPSLPYHHPPSISTILHETFYTGGGGRSKDKVGGDIRPLPRKFLCMEFWAPAWEEVTLLFRFMVHT